MRAHKTPHYVITLNIKRVFETHEHEHTHSTRTQRVKTHTIIYQSHPICAPPMYAYLHHYHCGQMPLACWGRR